MPHALVLRIDREGEQFADRGVAGAVGIAARPDRRIPDHLVGAGFAVDGNEEAVPNRGRVKDAVCPGRGQVHGIELVEHALRDDPGVGLAPGPNLNGCDVVDIGCSREPRTGRHGPSVPTAVSSLLGAVRIRVHIVQEQPQITVRSDMTVELVRASASDADVVFAARVSTVGEQSLDDLDADPASARGLIGYLMRERHGSPFEHNSMTFFVQAPIFVWREHMRHRIASYNEESGRYRELKPVFYVPNRDRNVVQVGKTGSYEFLQGSGDQYDLIEASMRESCARSFAAYQEMLRAGIAREVARMVLPVSIYSSAYVTMNARALMNFLSLRRKAEGSQYPSYPQREIEMVAEAYESEWSRLMPITHAAFVAGGRVAP